MTAFALAVIDAQIADCRATGHTGNVENLLAARASVADLIEALEIARKQMAHRGCGRVRPTSEWAEHGSMSFDNCQCDIRRVDAVRARVKGASA